VPHQLHPLWRPARVGRADAAHVRTLYGLLGHPQGSLNLVIPRRRSACSIASSSSECGQKSGARSSSSRIFRPDSLYSAFSPRCSDGKTASLKLGIIEVSLAIDWTILFVL